MKQVITLEVNGEARDAIVESRTTLQEVLRDQLRLTGVREGCRIGECGVCTVLLDGKVASSCLVLAMEVGKRMVTTIEGLALEERLHPLQESFIRHGAVQCGYCTSGMILSAKALLDRNPNPDTGQVQKVLEGNLCRCTGYNKIIEAVLDVREEPS